jgi:predicted nucleotidyltransferase
MKDSTEKYEFGLKNIDEILEMFKKVPAIKKVVIYGSRAYGNYKDGSDIDIALFGENLTLSNSVYLLMEEIENSYIPYMFDILIFDKINNEKLKTEILTKGKILYEK